jgi:sugar (pentulose or hexulose) kinase
MNNDYLGFRLTGRWAMDISTATTFYLQDQLARRWHRPYLELVGIGEEQLSPLADSGTVLGGLTPETAAATGLSTDTLVVLGAFDHPCAARGTGTLAEGELLLSCGTSWVDYYPLRDRSLGVAQGLLVDPFLAPKGPWGCMAALTAVGMIIDKYIDSTVLRSKVERSRKYEIFNTAAQQAPPGAGGLCLDLYRDNKSFLGEIGTATAAGHGREQVARALMEAAAFELKIQTDRLAAAGIAARRITMVGGPTESPIWPGIVAQTAGLPLRLVNGQTAGSVGAAVLAAIGCGLFADEREAFASMGGPEKLIEPQPAETRTYAELYGRYRERLGK